MKIGIIGNGFVGRATSIFAKNYFSKDEVNVERFEVLPNTVTTPAKPSSVMTHSADGTPHDPSQGGGIYPPFFKHMFFKPIDILIYDIRPEACQPPGITLDELDRECDLLFFCLPTPLNHDGTCYTKILEQAIARCSNPYKIIRSTIPVGFAAKHGCYFMPEFLTEARWECDFRSMKEWIIGIPTRDEHEEFKKRISKLINRSHKNGSIASNNIIFCDTNEAEMLKFMKNCFLSAKVGLMNELYDFSHSTQTDFTQVVNLAKLDARMGTTHFQVPGPDGRRGFGGTCFPKDTHSLYCQMMTKGIQSYIYPALLKRNDTHDRREREWMRDVWRTTIPLPTTQSKVVVVFTNGKEHSEYFDNIICENLSKNHVVIQVVRQHQHDSTSPPLVKPTNPNHIIKYWSEPSTAIFFPRVDECYYTPYNDRLAYQTIRDVMNIIDLWNSHEEMILYVVKNAKRTIDHVEANNTSSINADESGTEGFEDDDDEIHEDYDSSILRNNNIDYAKVFEDYYHNQFGDTQRRLVIMF